MKSAAQEARSHQIAKLVQRIKQLPKSYQLQLQGDAESLKQL